MSIKKKAKELLFPESLDVNIIDVDYSSYEYTNKYDITEKCSNIVIKAMYKNEPLRVIFYHGIGYKSCTVIDKVLVLREQEFSVGGNYTTFNLLSPDCFGLEQPTVVTREQEIEEELYKLLDNYVFEDDTSLYNTNIYFIEEVIDELEEISYIRAELKIKRDNVSLEKVKEVEKIFNDIRKTYIDIEGKKLLKEILSDKDCPQFLKDIAITFKFSKVKFEKVIISEDYMPDFGKYIIFEGALNGKQTDFGFLFENSETFTELTDRFDGIEFQSEEDL
jgi:hypothetical protein